MKSSQKTVSPEETISIFKSKSDGNITALEEIKITLR